MKAEFEGSIREARFKLHAGACPFCGEKSLFLLVTDVHTENVEFDKEMERGTHRVYGVLQGKCCQECILGIVLVNFEYGFTSQVEYSNIQYEGHYPLARPQNDFEEGVVPHDVAEDFLEAKKCYGAEAYKAAVSMCGRALESSCKEFKAKGKDLESKIDDLANRNLIPAAVAQMAHKIRLGRNRGIHPRDVNINEPYAKALIEFTRMYIEVVYVMPHDTNKFDVDGETLF